MKSFFSVFIYIIALSFAFLFIYPNFSVREYYLAVKPSFGSLSQNERDFILNNFLSKWNKDYNKDGDWDITPSPKNLKKEDKFFILKGRFITSSTINQITQENPDLILESGNYLKPSWVEEKFLNGKITGINFGLDLQGGMRVVLKGDFDTYKKKLLEVYSNEIKEIRTENRKSKR